MSSYESALEAAGAVVLAYKEFGSYQGDYIAKVRVGDQIAWIHDYYGSCSVCDALEGAMSNAYWTAGDGDREAAERKACRDYGLHILATRLVDRSEIERELQQSAEYDIASREALKWLAEQGTSEPEGG